MTVATLRTHKTHIGAQRQARYRQRQRDGRIVVMVEVDAEVVDFLIRKARWLSENEAADACTIGEAISRGLQLSSKQG